MRKKIYLRIGRVKGSLKVSAHPKPNYRPFNDGRRFATKYYPTILVPVLLNIPDESFESAQLELDVELKDCQNAIEVAKDEKLEPKIL